MTDHHDTQHSEAGAGGGDAAETPVPDPPAGVTTDLQAEPTAVEAEVVDSTGVEAEPATRPSDLGLELPDDPEQAQRLLLDELAASRAFADSMLDDLRRVAADFDNYRKRVARDQASLTARASERLVEALLPVLDSFEAGLAQEPQTETEAKILGGMRSTRDQMLDVLRREGLEPIESLGTDFDPEVHEAVMTSGDGDRLVVGQDLRRGYRLRGKLLRAALVALEAAES